MTIDDKIKTITVEQKGKLNKLQTIAFKKLKKETGYSGSQDIDAINSFFSLYSPGLLYDDSKSIVGVKIDYVLKTDSLNYSNDQKDSVPSAGPKGLYKNW